jgi:hypothetical protein
MDFESTGVIIINLIKEAVESEGCRLTEVDIENFKIKVDRPDQVVGESARAVAEILDYAHNERERQNPAVKDGGVFYGRCHVG